MGSRRAESSVLAVIRKRSFPVSRRQDSGRPAELQPKVVQVAIRGGDALGVPRPAEQLLVYAEALDTVGHAIEFVAPEDASDGAPESVES